MVIINYIMLLVSFSVFFSESIKVFAIFFLNDCNYSFFMNKCSNKIVKNIAINAHHYLNQDLKGDELVVRDVILCYICERFLLLVLIKYPRTSIFLFSMYN